MTRITKQLITRACDEAEDPWQVSNGMLYALCKRYPDHRDLKATTGKMLLIGRAYAASAERGRSGGSAAESSGDEFYIKDLPRALRNSPLDRHLDVLRRHKRLTESNTPEVIAAHTVLMDVLRDLTNVNKRSLASKYLHFHLPHMFFIYDSRAEEALRVTSTVPLNLAGLPAGADRQYCRFVAKALNLRTSVEARYGLRLTPRQLDRVLLALDFQRHS